MAARWFLPSCPLARILRRRCATKICDGGKVRRKEARRFPGRAGHRASRWKGQVWQICGSKSAWKLFLRWLVVTTTVCPCGQVIFSGRPLAADSSSKSARLNLPGPGSRPRMPLGICSTWHCSSTGSTVGPAKPPSVWSTSTRMRSFSPGMPSAKRRVSSTLLGATCTWVINCSSFSGSQVSLRLAT